MKLTIALGLLLSLAGCKDTYGQVATNKTPPSAIQSAGNTNVELNKAMSLLVMGDPIIPTPKPVYSQPNPASLRNNVHSNIVINSTNKPTAAYVNRFNSLRPDYHMDASGLIHRVTNSVSK